MLLEKLDHNFTIFGEVLLHVKDKVDNVSNKVDRIDEDMQVVKAEVAMIRHELKEKVGRDEFKLLEQRVLRLEKSAQLTS